MGRSVATADYAAAKCVEVTKIPAWADDIEEFAHRQFWAMQRTELVVLLPTDAATAGYADATADALADLGVVSVAQSFSVRTFVSAELEPSMAPPCVGVR